MPDLRPYQLISVLFWTGMAGWAWACFAHGLSLWLPVVWVVIYLHLLVLGAIRIRWNFFLRSFHCNPAAGKQIALTFDDGPAEQTRAILDVLRREEVEAGFFSIGQRAAAQPDLVRRWAAEGHVIGNHSYTHGFNFDWKSTRNMVAELEETNAAIERITGLRPKLFRPPYGVTNPNLARAVRRTGMYSVGWSIRSFDTTAKDPEQLLQRILGRLRSGDVILLHDSMAITHEILTPLIRMARQKGFTFVRPDKLLNIEAYA